MASGNAQLVPRTDCRPVSYKMKQCVATETPVIEMAPLLLLFIVFLSSATADHDPLVVQTAQGKVRGSILKTIFGKDVFSFRGVKYAEAPSGPNRFKPPIPVKPWDGIRDATKDGIYCPQPYVDNNAEHTVTDPEDCLFLNVYTKNLKGNQPVMVFFHQGGFMTGTGFSRIAGPRYLLDKDIVLVTLNYRLGPLGFLSTGDGVVKGNNGMKDQVTALRWVKQNIARFGGNPDAVTIFGNSAGSASVQYHMLSPMSRGLFIRGISMSGDVLGGWACNRDPVSLAKRLTRLLGCEDKTSQQIYNCLKDIPAQNIANTTLLIKDFGLDLWTIFSVVVEKDFGDGEESFLTAEPLHLLQTKQFAQFPLMVGITTNETGFRGEILLRHPELAEQFDKEFDRYAPMEFQYIRSGPVSKHISHTLRKFYFDNKGINNDTETELSEMYTDNLIHPITQTARLIAEKSSAPVYFYQFDYIGRYSGRYKPGTNTSYGAIHSDDLFYLLSNNVFIPEFNATDPEVKVIKLMTSLWTNFAITGDPNIKDYAVKWEKLQKDHYKYLRISDTLELKQGLPFPARMALWDSLFPLSGPRQISF